MKMNDENKEQAYFRIKELIEKTGISRETIHFYLSEGLLPEPNKKTKNMSWYSQEHIDRLNIIKELQEKQFLPLKAIKAILNNVDDHNFTQEQQNLIQSIKNKINDNQEKSSSLSQIIKEKDISLDEINEMKSIGFIENGKYFTNEDSQLIDDWINLKSLGINQKNGFSVKNLDILIDIAEIIFNQEFEIFTQRLSNLNEKEIISIVEDSIPVINNIISTLHQKRVHKFINDFKAKE